MSWFSAFRASLHTSQGCHVVQHPLALRQGGVVLPDKGRALRPLGLALPVLPQRLRHRLRQPPPEPLDARVRAPRLLLLHQHAQLGAEKPQRASAPGPDGRGAAGQALDEDRAEGLPPGGEDADLGHGEELRERLLALGAEEERPLQRQVPSKARVPLHGLRGPAADDDGAAVGQGPFVDGRGVKDSVQPLPVSKLADKSDDPPDAGQLVLVIITHMPL
mmetsp:Transcript_92441/g.299098  ORF Transcript_92441/g.299098 Transcript_92441/m.299098 type:complete len:219 (-) Transcript_92441:245-901(-)